MYVVKQTSEGLDGGCIDGDEDSDVVVSVSPAPAQGFDETGTERFDPQSLDIGV